MNLFTVEASERFNLSPLSRKLGLGDAKVMKYIENMNGSKGGFRVNYGLSFLPPDGNERPAAFIRAPERGIRNGTRNSF